MFAYADGPRNEMLDLLFKPDYAASLATLKVEIGSDDQTTNGCESCHMRSPTELNCSRGYEWPLMVEAVKRNPNITLYGLPWGFAGWLGNGTTNPFHNPATTADYIAKWVECGRDTHALNISVLGIWNEAWNAAGRPDTDPWEFALALRRRLDSSGLGHVRLVAPDGSPAQLATVLKEMDANASYRAVIDGLAQHYPGSSPGDTVAALRTGLPMWSTEDYATYSDPSGGGCWARRLVQNANFGFSSTISYYLIGAFARGVRYDASAFLRADWPSSGHWEPTPMLDMTMMWTRFTKPGWKIYRCPPPPPPPTRKNAPRSDVSQCALRGGGNYVVLASDVTDDVTIIVETMQLANSRCRLGPDPSGYNVAASQNVTLLLPERGTAAVGRETLDVWRSCIGWRYPAADDQYMIQLDSIVASADGAFTFTAERDCSYTLTTVRGVSKLPRPRHITAAVSFPLPFHDDFEGATAGGEAPYWGDQMGKWETVPAGGGRDGMASQQQLGANKPWPIQDCRGPHCHSQPLSIIGDMFFVSNQVSADLLIEEPGVGAGLALRLRSQHDPRASWSGLFLYIGSLPGCAPDGKNFGGLPPAPNIASRGWALCSDSYCRNQLREGALPAGSAPLLQHWHSVRLEVTRDLASGAIDGHTIFSRVSIGTRSTPTSACVVNTTVVRDGREIVGSDYRQTVLAGNSTADIETCARECCADPKCKAWAVSASAQMACPANRTCCWLKSGGSFNGHSGHGGGESACGLKPAHAQDAGVPSSGWAGIVSTLGKSQVDNFALLGTEPSATHASGTGAAVPPCGVSDGTAHTGLNLSSTPCDYPGARTGWGLSKATGELQLLGGESVREGSALCIGAGGSNSGNISLVACGSPTALVFDEASGRISPRESPGRLCVTAIQRAQHQLRSADVVLSPCGASSTDSRSEAAHSVSNGGGAQKTLGGAASLRASSRSRGKPIEVLPQDAQQFQYHPGTGRLRHKASSCISSFPNTASGLYRDCCVALCPRPV